MKQCQGQISLGLKCLADAVVPLQFYPALQVIAEIEEGVQDGRTQIFPYFSGGHFAH